MSLPAEVNPGTTNATHLDALLRELLAIRDDIVAAAARERQLERVHANHRESARNLLHYLALRRRDLRLLQGRLATLGLSSLGRAEAHVLATVDAVLETLHQVMGRAWTQAGAAARVADFAAGERLLAEHTEALLGRGSPGRPVRIMVTMPSEAADDYTLVHELLAQGMDCMRIDCARDDAQASARMIEHLRRAERALGRSCRVVMDLAGPRLRTGAIEPGPAVVRVRPRQDAFGRVVAAARIWFTADTAPRPAPSPADACLPVRAAWLAALREGDRVKLRDARDKRRRLRIVDATDDGCWAEATETTYFAHGTELRRERAGGQRKRCRKTRVGNLPGREQPIVVKPLDRLVVTREPGLGRAATYDSSGRVLTPAAIGCTIPGVLDDVRAGEAIWFDDGRIGGIIETVAGTHVVVRITRARLRGEKLRSDKGINLPDSDLRRTALTPQDQRALAFAAEHADVVELSANSPKDVELLQQRLAQLGSRQPNIVLVIETRRGFEQLPAMLLAAMSLPCCGVMIARGDLAVECGFERLAEVQQEILRICEAAHVPVIWATQVLGTLAREGMPSRAEIADAAMGHRAECVMLDKGLHGAVRVLDDILRRMQPHQLEQRAMLRELRLVHTLPGEALASGEATARPGG